MNVRERTQEIERCTLSPYAALSENTLGRRFASEPCELRTEYQRDRDRIIHCKAFRRLKQKTQVFLSPEGDHYRTRLTHTLEVSQIARTIARALRLNEDLTEAIALGHDLGHTPFGHSGEAALNKLSPDGFCHYLQSVRVVEKLENDHKGLNLTHETVDGIANHTKGEWAATYEGRIVRHADRIAYICHDIEDAVSAGVLSESDIPTEINAVLGNTKSQRITTLITDIVNNSGEDVVFSEDVKKAYDALHKFMYDNIYLQGEAKKEEHKVEGLITMLYNHFSSSPDKLPPFYRAIAESEGVDRAVVDYISGMSDAYAVWYFKEIFIPGSWAVK